MRNYIMLHINRPRNFAWSGYNYFYILSQHLTLMLMHSLRSIYSLICPLLFGRDASILQKLFYKMCASGILISKIRFEITIVFLWRLRFSQISIMTFKVFLIGDELCFRFWGFIQWSSIWNKLFSEKLRINVRSNFKFVLNYCWNCYFVSR